MPHPPGRGGGSEEPEISSTLGTRSVTEALNRIDDFAALGRVSLAHIPAVDAYLARTGAASTPFQRGRVLSHLIQRSIQEQALSDRRRSRHRDAAEWSILYLRVHQGRTLEEIAHDLSMPLRSVGRYYARAKGLLLDQLLSLDGDTGGRSLHCPLCGTLVATRDTSTAADHTCPTCRARFRVDEVSNSAEMVIHVRRREET